MDLLNIFMMISNQYIVAILDIDANVLFFYNFNIFQHTTGTRCVQDTLFPTMKLGLVRFLPHDEKQWSKQMEVTYLC